MHISTYCNNVLCMCIFIYIYIYIIYIYIYIPWSIVRNFKQILLKNIQPRQAEADFGSKLTWSQLDRVFSRCEKNPPDQNIGRSHEVASTLRGGVDWLFNYVFLKKISSCGMVIDSFIDVISCLKPLPIYKVHVGVEDSWSQRHDDVMGPKKGRQAGFHHNLWHLVSWSPAKPRYKYRF